MAAGPLHPDNLTNGKDRDVTRGHGTRALGPSDSSDSGSDLVGAPGPDIGDPDNDGDSDRSGTGETASADPDIRQADGADIDTDHIERIPGDDGDDEANAPGRQAPRH